MRAGRLLSILMLLQLRVRLTADELAREFEVSVRTIYRDIEELGAAGVPIYGDRGPGGGFQLLDGYRTRVTGLTTHEAEAMFMIGLPAAADALGLGESATGAGRKLLAAMPAPLSDGAGRLGRCFHLDPVDWYRSADRVDHLPTLARAVLDQHVVRMTYESWRDISPWAIEPYGLVLKAGTWYVVGRGHGKVRIFRASKISALTTDGTRFERPDDFDLGTYWTTELARFEDALRPMTAIVRVNADGADRLSRIGAHAARAVADATADDEPGWRSVTLPIESIDQAAHVVLGLGVDALVVEPAPLRARVAELAMHIHERARRE